MRWRVIGLLGLISALTFVDRVNLSIAGKYIQDQFAFNTETMGWILSAFSLGYALSQVPAGWLGDHFGPKKIITIAILWWSFFTVATAFAGQIPWVGWIGVAWSFALGRFLLGMGEAAAFPNSNRLIADWVNPQRRGTANSIFLVGIGLGGAATPIAISWIMRKWGWQPSFYICAILGLVLAIAWHLYVTDRPEEHRGVNQSELQVIRSAPLQNNTYTNRAEGVQPENLTLFHMLRKPSVWFLILSYFCIGYPAYIYYTWFFIYLIRVRHLPIETGGLWGSTPFIAILILTPVGGWFSDRAIKKWGRRRGRQSTVWLGVVLSAAMLAAGARITDNTYAIVLLALAAGFNLFATPTWWATCNDLSPRNSGSLSGLMNMGGNIGGWISPILTATIAVKLGWEDALYFGSIMTLAAGFFWIFIDVRET